MPAKITKPSKVKTRKVKADKASAKLKGTRYVCVPCGTEVIMTECGPEFSQLVCCGVRMKEKK